MAHKNKTYYATFIISALFFVFGFVTWLNSILIPFLQTACELTHFQASFVTFAFYIAYFVMAIPSSMILKRTGFARGMSLGLIVMAIGTMLFVPAAMERSYLLFLVGLFVQGTGLALLQSSANPYVTIIGPVETAARRMSLMGVCNKLAGIVGIFLLTQILFSKTGAIREQLLSTTDAALRTNLLGQLATEIILPYIIMTAILMALVLFLKLAKLPEVEEEGDPDEAEQHCSIFSYPYLWLGVLAIFFYVGAEVIAIDYLAGYGKFAGLPEAISLRLGAFALVALIVGYLLGIALVPRFLSQRRALVIQTLLALALVAVAISTSGAVSVVAIIGLSFANAIMWPVIWPLSIHDLGKRTKLGSALLIMAIAGGALIPLVYGKLADLYSPHAAYGLLFGCYTYILFFATIGYRINGKHKSIHKF